MLIFVEIEADENDIMLYLQAMIILLIEIRAELEKYMYLMHFEMNNDMFSNDHIQFKELIMVILCKKLYLNIVTSIV